MSDPRSLNEPVRCLSSALRRTWQPAAWPSGLVAHTASSGTSLRATPTTSERTGFPTCISSRACWWRSEVRAADDAVDHPITGGVDLHGPRGWPGRLLHGSAPGSVYYSQWATPPTDDHKGNGMAGRGQWERWALNRLAHRLPSTASRGRCRKVIPPDRTLRHLERQAEGDRHGRSHDAWDSRSRRDRC